MQRKVIEDNEEAKVSDGNTFYCVCVHHLHLRIYFQFLDKMHYPYLMSMLSSNVHCANPPDSSQHMPLLFKPYSFSKKS